ncbi:MAG: hypothetical protein CVV13_02485 [Gammaproteobacteria bacterium HGW-Gammaproteobacteria-3]|nr:MAG: hypothetical protein CVV13_02485 [Gammaproteobacteria bacterium HGW-Gammaproteobacteria-3]
MTPEQLAEQVGATTVLFHGYRMRHEAHQSPTMGFLRQPSPFCFTMNLNRLQARLNKQDMQKVCLREIKAFMNGEQK